MHILQHSLVDLDEALNGFFNQHLCKKDGFHQAFFVDSTGFRFNMDVEGRISNYPISFETFDMLAFEVVYPTMPELMRRFNQFCAFLASRNRKHYQSLFILQCRPGTWLPVFCGRVNTFQSCLRMYNRLQIPISTSESEPCVLHIAV